MTAYRPWTFPDVRDALLAVMIWHAGFAALFWWAGSRYEKSRASVEAECPADRKLARRDFHFLKDGTTRVSCVYFWSPKK